MHDSFPKTATIPCMQRLQSSYITLMKNPQLWNTNLNSAFQIIVLTVPIAVNLSAGNLIDQSLPDNIQALLNKHNVLANLLEIEITESAFY